MAAEVDRYPGSIEDIVNLITHREVSRGPGPNGYRSADKGAGGFFMATFTRRSWYFAALTLATGAIAIQLFSKHHAGLGIMPMARSAEALHVSKRYAESGRDALANAEANESARLRQVAHSHARRADLRGGVSLCLAGLALFKLPRLEHFMHMKP